MAARLAAAIAAAAALCACAGPGDRAASDGRAFAGAIPVAPIRVGEEPEACMLDGAAPPPDSSARAAWELRCGAWEAPAAVILGFEAAPPETLVADGGWRARLDAFADCSEAAKPLEGAGGPAAALSCSVTAGRWPYHAFAVQRCGRGFLVDGVASALPSVLDALDRLCGAPAPTAPDPAAAYAAEIAALEAELGAASYGPDDIDRFDKGLRLAQLWNFGERYADSERLYLELLEMQERAIRERPDLAHAAPYGGLGFLYMHIALELSNVGAFERADAWFEDAGELLDREGAIARTEQARLMSYRALHLGNRNRPEAALREARAATELRRRLVEETEMAENDAADRGVAALRGDIAQSLVIEATLLERIGDLGGASRALSAARKALAADPEAPPHWSPQAHLIEARLHEATGDRRAALAATEQAIDAQRALFPASRTEALAHFTRSRLLTELNRPEEAMVAFETGLEALRDSDATLMPDDALPAMRLAQARIEAGDPQADALRLALFELAQLVRGPVVANAVDRVAAGFAPEDAEAASALRELEARRREATLLDEAVARATADPETLAFTLTALREQRQAAYEAAREAARDARAAAPGYETLVDERTTLEGVREALRPNEAFAALLVGGTGSFVVFVDAQGVQTYAVPLAARTLAEGVEALTGPLRADPVEPISRDWAVRSAELFEAFFGPVRMRLAAAERLTVAPSGPLLALPFDILLESADGPLAPERMPWLARRVVLAAAASPSSFVKLRTRTAPSRGQRAFVGFGDFQPSGDAEAVLRELDMPLPSCRPQAERIATLDRLPATRREVERIAAAFGTRPSLGIAFSETALKTDADVQQARILYLATHGLLRQPFDCLPEPALVTSGSAGEDGVLTATEAANLELNADLVVLSACDTAGGGGEALSGLARAFFAAGSRAVLASHWPVFDEQTAELMASTFARFRTGGDAAAALHAAKLDFIADPDRAHPVYWGPFALIGG